MNQHEPQPPITARPEAARALRKHKGRAPLCALTAYDYPTARLLDEAGIDVILVGDSLGMVVLGYPDTTSVTLADMIRHTQAARRGVRNACLVADIPASSSGDAREALAGARALMAAGADAVKIEGGADSLTQVRAILDAGVPLVGHIGMLPQRVVVEGAYRRKGRTPEQAAALLKDARALDSAGVSAIVLESIDAAVAGRITRDVACPTIGIGSGNGSCDGEIRVLHDLIGMFPWFRPPFAECYHDGAAMITDAASRFRESLSRP